MTDLAICIPAQDKVNATFLISLIRLTDFLRNNHITSKVYMNFLKPWGRARTALAEDVLRSDEKAILWLDADMEFYPNDFAALWNHMSSRPNVAALSGLYFKRRYPCTPVFFQVRDGVNIDNPFYPTDRPFRADRAGMGFMLMRREALFHTYLHTKEKPFVDNADESEDFYFFRKFTELGYELWMLPDLVIKHDDCGMAHFRWTVETFYQGVTDLAEYLKEGNEETYTKCALSAQKVADEWNEKFKGRQPTAAEITEFYAGCKVYLHDLTFWWIRSTFKDSILTSFRYMDGKKVLDFGCGIGNFAREYAVRNPDAVVECYDVSKPSIDYMKWRLAKRPQPNVKIREYSAADFDARGVLIPWATDYDVIICMDVIEHLPEADENVLKLRSMLKMHGKMFATVAPAGKNQPQHIASDVNLKELGFVQVDEFAYEKVPMEGEEGWVKPEEKKNDVPAALEMKP